MNAQSQPSRWQVPSGGLAAMLVLLAALGAGRWLRTRASASTAGSPVAIARVDSQIQPPPPAVSRGEIVFQLYCAKCHGPEGHGDPDALARQQPPPRDFASRPWRFAVSKESIRRVTADGIPQTAMPSHRAALTEADLQAVVDHTYHLATSGPIFERSPLERHLLAAGFNPEPAPRPAPQLLLVDAAGRTASLAEHRGRVVLLNFWGVSCEHCLASMPNLHAQAKKWQTADKWLSAGPIVLNICADAEDASSAQQVATRVSTGLSVWIDQTGLANAQYEVQALPTIWLVDSSGNLLARAHGALDWSSPELAKLIEFLTSSPAATPSP